MKLRVLHELLLDVLHPLLDTRGITFTQSYDVNPLYPQVNLPTSLGLLEAWLSSVTIIGPRIRIIFIEYLENSLRLFSLKEWVVLSLNKVNLPLSVRINIIRMLNLLLDHIDNWQDIFRLSDGHIWLVFGGVPTSQLVL